MKKLSRLSFPLAMLLAVIGAHADSVRLDQLDLSKMKQGWGKPQINRSMREKPLTPPLAWRSQRDQVTRSATIGSTIIARPAGKMITA